MVKSRQRKQIEEANKKFIVKSKRIWWSEGIVIFFTTLVWIYCLMVIFFFMEPFLPFKTKYSSAFRTAFQLTRLDIRGFLIAGAGIFVMIYVGLYLWSVYNKKRFGSLTRRKYPPMTTKEDLLALDMIDEEIYQQLQNSKSIVLETNPVRIKEEVRKRRTKEEKNVAIEGQDS